MFGVSKASIVEMARAISEFSQHIRDVVNNHAEILNEANNRLKRIEKHLELIEERRINELENRKGK
jgi:DNA integrity scanning protein DisA with diadenylate cyclase activity